jgi:ligand-binding sensor domain-containing protein
MMFKILKKRLIKNNTVALFRLLWSLVFLLIFTRVCQAQKYTFSHYDIEDGLIESQVNNLSLDNEHRLWMATSGGACRFDGKEYTPYTRQNGMPTNFINTVFADKNDVVWFGTQNGLVKLVNKKLISCPVPGKLKNNRVNDIVQEGNGATWFVMSNQLFRISGNVIKEQFIQDTIKKPIICLAVDRTGKLFASVYQKGIYYLDKGKWVNLFSFPANEKLTIVYKMIFDRTDNNKLFMLTGKGIYTIKDKMLQPYESKLMSAIKTPLLSLAQDAAGNLWTGSTNGAYCINLLKRQVIHFVAYNGLSDNAITDIYNDADNNLWMASQGNGFYKYEGDRVITFDRSQGLSDNEVTMGIVKDRDNHILVGINGGGLLRYDGKKLVPVKLPATSPGLNQIQCLHTDKKGLCG